MSTENNTDCITYLQSLKYNPFRCYKTILIYTLNSTLNSVKIKAGHYRYYMRCLNCLKKQNCTRNEYIFAYFFITPSFILQTRPLKQKNIYRLNNIAHKEIIKINMHNSFIDTVHRIADIYGWRPSTLKCWHAKLAFDTLVIRLKACGSRWRSVCDCRHRDYGRQLALLFSCYGDETIMIVLICTLFYMIWVLPLPFLCTVKHVLTLFK